jgi:site-specific DNA-cytosine methylase
VNAYDAIDCQAFAGGYTLGTVQAGFRLVGKREQKGGFGVVPCENNRHLLGNDWQAEACEPVDWTPYAVPYVFGNPPCSGFSLLSSRDFRGPDSSINSCMWAFVAFASRCQPEIMVFESVAQAYKEGRDLFRALRADVEARTGQQWELTHVLHNAYSVGGAAIRRRYFFVCHRVPFSVEPYDLRRVPVLNDVIGDLQGLTNTWEPQPYRREPTWWSKTRRSDDGLVDGHHRANTPAIRRALELIDETGVEWGPREHLSVVAARYWDRYGDLPESWHHLGSYEKKLKHGPPFFLGYNTMIRWSGERAARVITGAGLDLVLHPQENRTITHRESLRIMGFPDDWTVRQVRGASGLKMMWGKGIAVDCGRWISTWVRRALDGEPGTYPRTEVGDREWTVDLTNDYKDRALSREN